MVAMLLPLLSGAATMKVGDLIASSNIRATNTVTGSNVIDRFNIRWWGADPTGVTNSTEAISNALSWVASGRLYVPQGTYRIITLHVTNNFITISGDGPGGSTFHSSNAAPMFVFSGANPIFEKINLQGNGIANQGLHFTNSEQATVRDVVIDKIIGPGIFAQDSSFSMLFDRVRVIQSHIGIHLTNGFQNSRIDHCLLYFNTNYNVLLGTVGTPHVNVSIKNSELESSGQTATNLLINDVASVILDGVYFESTQSAGKDIVVDGTTSLVGINGMYANGSGVSTNSIFVTSAASAVSLKNSHIFNYTTSPFVAHARAWIENSSLNGTYHSTVIGSYAYANVTNVLAASATLDFPSTSVGAVADLRIAVTGAEDGDVVAVGAPSGSTTTMIGSYSGFASNASVFVRFTPTAVTQDPASGTFKVLVTKF